MFDVDSDLFVLNEKIKLIQHFAFYFPQVVEKIVYSTWYKVNKSERPSFSFQQAVAVGCRLLPGPVVGARGVDGQCSHSQAPLVLAKEKHEDMNTPAEGGAPTEGLSGTTPCEEMVLIEKNVGDMT